MRLLGAFGSMARSSKWSPTPCLRPNGVVQVTTKKDPRIRPPHIPVACFKVKKGGGEALAVVPVESAIVQRGEQSSMDKSSDQDRGKGATEQNPQSQGEGGNTSMKGQLGHRDENAELKNADSDLPGVRPAKRGSHP